MYSIFYIYTYKYTRLPNTLMLSRPQRPYKPRTHKQPDKLYSPTSAERKPYIWAKCTSRIMHQAIWSGDLHICGDFEKLHNAFCVSVLSLFVTTLKMFCNLFVIHGQNRRVYAWEN